MTTAHIILTIYLAVVVALSIYAWFHRSPDDEAPAILLVVMILLWFVIFPIGWFTTIRNVLLHPEDY